MIILVEAFLINVIYFLIIDWLYEQSIIVSQKLLFVEN